MDKRFNIFLPMDGPHIDGLICRVGILRFYWQERDFRIRPYDRINADSHYLNIQTNAKEFLD